MLCNCRLVVTGSRYRLFATITIPVLLAACLLFAMPQLALAQGTFTVCPSGCDYTSPDTAVNDAARVDGDTIDITTGTYVLGSAMQIVNSITINGNGSTLNANGNRALEVTGTSPVVIVNDVTIRNGRDPGESSGGAIVVSGGATFALSGSTVENSSADGSGGGLSNSDSLVDIFDSAFISNDAGFAGGAIRTFGATAVTNLTRVTIDGNQAGNIGGGFAAISDGTINVFESTISNNAALTSSVIIDNFTGPITPGTNCGTGPYGQTFLAGSGAISAFHYRVRVAGGGIPTELIVTGRLRKDGPTGPLLATTSTTIPAGLLDGETPTLVFVLDQPIAMDPLATYAIETEIVGNYSVITTQGPGTYLDGQAYSCSTSLNNDDYDFQILGGTPGDGGGIYSGGTVNLTNSTISGNVGDGAFAGAPNHIVSTEFSTIINNSGNGLTVEAGNPGGVIAPGGSILAGNGGGDCFSDGLGTFSFSAGFNLIGDITGCGFLVRQGSDLVGGGGLPPIDPLLGSLQDNGGSTFTHALDPNSPAIDAGGACSLSNDQRGTGRPQAVACDIGAFELAPPDNPVQTLINAAPAGATIDLPDGVYNDPVSIGDGKTLSGSGPNNVVIDVSNLNVSAITATGDFTLNNIRVTGGSSASNGGGIIANVAGTNINLIDVELDNNTAVSDGGAIYLLNGTLTATNVTFSNNSAGGNGGAILGGTASTSTITASQFENNSATSAGGAIFNEGDMSIMDTTINASTAGVGGGIFNAGSGSLDVGSSTLSNNSATSSQVTAGGAMGGAGEINVFNSTISGNSAVGNGGGIGLTGGAARLNNVTLAYNASSSLGGPFYADAGALISFSNSLLSDNTSDADNCGNVTSLGYNLFQNAICQPVASDIIDEPLIGLLAANGGPTLTHALDNLSPAIDAGHPVSRFTQFDTANFAQLQTQGFARLDAGTLYLAGGVFSVGSAFVTNPIDPGEDFSAQFQFEIVAGASGAADGFTFTISDDPTALGQAGGFLGIGASDPIEPSPAVIGVINGVSVEFDTWLNGAGEGANDPDLDHIGIDFNGSLSSEVLTVIGPHGTLSDGNVWTAWVDYFSANNILEVRASNTGIRPALPTVSAGVDVESLTGPVAYAGFTGATGSAGISGEQRILNFSFESSCMTVDQRGESRPQGSRCDIGAYEAATIPLDLGAVTLSMASVDQDLADGLSYPGVVDVPIIDIPIEKLTGDTFNAPESAPLGSFPLGSFPIGSFELRNSPLGSFPLGSFPIGSFPIGSFPLGSFPLSSIPLQQDGGWKAVLDGIPELADAPLQTVTFEQLLRLSPLPDSIASIALRDLSIQGSPLGSFSLPGVSLGDTSVDELDDWALNADPLSQNICDTLVAADSSFTSCSGDDTLLGLQIKGAPVSALSLSSLPLGSFQVGGLPIGSFPLGSFPIGSFPLGSFPIGSFPIGSFPIGSFPIGSFPIGSFPLGSFNLLAAPIGSFPLGSFPIGSFPIGSFEIDGMTFCEFFDEQTPADESDTCSGLGLSPTSTTLADVLQALAGNGASNLGSTPLGSFPMGSFPIGSFPIGSFDLQTLGSPPLSLLTLDDFDGCQAIDGTADCSSTPSLSGTSSLVDVAEEYGTMAASPLGSFPIGSFDVSFLPMGSFPIGSFEVNGTPLGSFPLGSFDLIGSPLGSFPIGSFPSVINDPTGICAQCQTLADASRAGVISDSATLADLSPSEEFDNTTFGEVLDAMTLAMLYGTGTLANIKDAGNLTLGQLLIAMMLKTDFPWETISLDQLDTQGYSADHLVAYNVDISLNGSETSPVSTAVTLAGDFLYVQGSAQLQIETRVINPPEPINDPLITNNEDGTQTLVFNLTLGGFSNNRISFKAVPALALGIYPASATVQLGEDLPVTAENSNGAVTIVADPFTDVSIVEELTTTPANVLTLGFINTPDDIDLYKVAAPAKGDRVAVFMSNPAGDNDLIMYEPLSTVEAKGQTEVAPPLDSVPFEDDGISYEGNLSEEPNALEDINLGTNPLASTSTNRGEADEAVSAIAGNTEPFIIQVSGYNGAVSDLPYTLRVKVTSEVPNPQCTPRTWPDSAGSTVLPAGTWTANTNAVFLVNGARLASSDAGGMTSADEALTAINNLISAPGIIDGVVVDVSTIDLVDYSGWDMNPCDVDEANKIVNAITGYLEEMRAGSPNLTYVTIVGSDEVIPFARKPDETSIANESTFAGEFADNAMFGALVTRHFLSDDTYGDIDPILWFDRYLNVPELAVGRLVESAEDILTAAENYINFAGVLNPRTALSAGYDFIADASENINDTFTEYSSVLGFSVEPALIDPPGITPETDAWTEFDFFDATGLNTPRPVELVSFNMHFDFDEALPSIGDATGNYTDNLIDVTDLDGARIEGGIWFTVGCHSGTNVPDVSVIGSAPSQDWAQTFSHLGALYLAQNAYGLGDTEAIALTERLMANFARNLTGSMTIGQAHAFAKQQYFADLGLYGEYDFKALQAATLFGLPMYRYGNGATVTLPAPLPLPIFTDPISGLASATWSVSDTGITQTETSKGSLFSVDGDVQFVHFRPLQPIVRRDVTSPGGDTAGGAFLTKLTTEDVIVADIAFARPVIDLGENEPEIETDEVVFPTVFTNIAAYKAPSPDGGPFEPRDQLNVIVGQFTSPLDGASDGIERLFRDFEAQVFYRPATTPASDDFIRPEFNNIQASIVGSSSATQAGFSVDVEDNGTVLRVSVLYLQSVTGDPARGNWVMVDLAPGAGGNVWTGGGLADSSAIQDDRIDYMVQAIDDNGNVANSTFKGLFYPAKRISSPPDGNDPDDPFVVQLIDPNDPQADLKLDDWNPVDSIRVVITVLVNVSYEYSVDGSRPLLPLTPDGFIVSGDGVHIVDLFGSDGSRETFVLLIDNTPAEIVIATPSDGGYVVQGLEPPADYFCRDAGSGVANCNGDVAVGNPVPDGPPGPQAFVVRATDNTGLMSEASSNYFVVQKLQIAGPTEPVLINSTVSLTATATDLAGINEFVSVDWGDGTISTSTSAMPVTQNGNQFKADHVYTATGAYPITVTIDYDGGAHIQEDVFEFAIIYDPRGGLVTEGFVTGAGWIDSPPGAYTPNDESDPDITGKAHFNIASKYRKRKPVPDSTTSFRIDNENFQFIGISHEWLVIEGERARYQGVGRLNGGNELYNFQVIALDADIPGNGNVRDGFRLKIWQESADGSEVVLYDNGLGVENGSGSDGTTILGGGTITVHESRGK